MTGLQGAVLLAWGRDAYRGIPASFGPGLDVLKERFKNIGRFRSRILETPDYCEKIFPHKGNTADNVESWPQPTKLKPRWDVHLSGDDDQLGCSGESLSSVLGE